MESVREGGEGLRGGAGEGGREGVKGWSVFGKCPYNTEVSGLRGVLLYMYIVHCTCTLLQ